MIEDHKHGALQKNSVIPPFVKQLLWESLSNKFY